MSSFWPYPALVASSAGGVLRGTLTLNSYGFFLLIYLFCLGEIPGVDAGVNTLGETRLVLAFFPLIFICETFLDLLLVKLNALGVVFGES